MFDSVVQLLPPVPQLKQLLRSHSRAGEHHQLKVSGTAHGQAAEDGRLQDFIRAINFNSQDLQLAPTIVFFMRVFMQVFTQVLRRVSMAVWSSKRYVNDHSLMFDPISFHVTVWV